MGFTTTLLFRSSPPRRSTNSTASSFSPLQRRLVGGRARDLCGGDSWMRGGMRGVLVQDGRVG
ncbi:hypothetical protein LINGRAHAP2_LOCUS11442 [Linum grandiflorum]